MENQRLYGRICYLQRQMSRENNVMFSEHGITPLQMHVLIYLHKSKNEGKSVCQKDIEKYINLRPSSVSSLLGTLDKAGLIMRTVSEGDARTKYVTLTEEGIDICMKKKLLMEKCDALVESALTEEEQQTFNSLLDKILAEIQKQEKEVKND